MDEEFELLTQLLANLQAVKLPLQCTASEPVGFAAFTQETLHAIEFAVMAPLPVISK